jgi:hypothetical protein
MGADPDTNSGQRVSILRTDHFTTKIYLKVNPEDLRPVIERLKF